MEKALSELVGTAMWTCRRAADMATFQFGQRKQVHNFYGHPKEVGEYALHVQCAWRIVRGDTVAVGSRDLYSPAQHPESESIPEDFDWDRDPNRRDSLLDALFDGGKREFHVRRVDAGSGGTCRIEFAEGICLELFPDDSFAHEHWRLFGTDDGGPQVVTTGVDDGAERKIIMTDETEDYSTR
jgi:hypothetical protein